MITETTFRIAAAVLFICLLIVLFRYRGPSERQGEKISWREEGWFVMVTLRTAGFSMWLSILVYVINPRWMAWSQVSLPAGLRWVGAGLVVLAMPLAVWVLKSIGKNITQTVGIRKKHQLVTHGPYRWIRHPLYTVGTLIFIGFSLLTASWFTAVTALIGFVMLLVRLPQEEANLIGRFGDEYREYMQMTGRLFPKFY